MEKLDNVDRKILAALVENSKIMSKELSRKLRIHPNTLLQRLKKLEAAGVIIKYQAVVDFPKVDKMMQVLMFIKVNMEKPWEDALRATAKFPEIVSYILVTGEYDVVVIARVRDESHLADLMRRVQATRVVNKTTTHLIVDFYKQPHEYNPLKYELMI
ncbi:MAG TPA: Lrp/AsnC family transcriptional regulator [Candidatus Bilamarchaeum sp.]|nr:Lrp/AsnC family transcriptional regulator [Candidatus Bilamarchaeum sp.]